MNLSSTKNKLIILGILFLGLLVLTYNTKDSIQEKNEVKNKGHAYVTNTPKDTRETYYGVLPCDFCEGVETNLVLTKTQMGDNGTYTLSEKKLGFDNTFITFDGIWTTAEGLNEDPNAQIIVLNPDNEDIIRGFYIVNEKEIEDLDEYGNRYEDFSKHRLNLK